MRRNLVLWMFAMLLTVSVAWAQTRTVNGQVRDSESGDPLFGVGVLEKGTVNGTLTDFDGRFTLTVPDGSIIVITYVGYQTQEVVANANEISVILELGLQLQEFVVTGYQEIAREKMTGSVATITPASLEKFSMTSFDQILQGKAPGLLVLGGSGQPGAPAGRVQIRGQGSIAGGNAPIYIVDGIPLNYSNYSALNSRDFESISVLKDASSASLYGARGANGVIVVTTKKGRPGQTAVNYSTSFGFSTFIEPNYGVMSSSEKLALENYYASIGLQGVGPGGIYGPDGTAPDPAFYAYLESRNINWKRELTQLGFTHSHNLSFTGGNEKTTFHLSGNYVDQEGQIERSSISRGGFRANIEHKVNDRFKLSSNSYVSYRKSSFIESEGAINTNNIYALMYLLNPYDSIFNPDGTYNFGFTFAINRNPLEAIRTRTNILKETRLLGNLRAAYELVDGLTVSNNVGVDMSSRNSSRYVDPNSDIGDEVQGGRGSIARDLAQSLAIVNTSLLEYNKTFSNRHNLDLLGGFEIYRQQNENFGVTAYGLNPKIATIAGSSAGSATNGFIPLRRGGETENMLMGGLLRGSYSYMNRYVVTAGFRRDGSSRFGAENRFANFWNVGAAWNIHNEQFLKGNKVVDELKITASYGTLGNQENIGNFQSLGTYGTTAYNGIPGIAPANPEYPELKWEVLSTANVGVDFGLWKSRVNGTVNFYNNVTTDLFVTQELSRTTGFTSLDINTGKVLNRGVEVMLDIDLVRTKNFLWNVYGNFTYNKNEVLDLGKADEFESGTAIIKEGYPIGTHFEVGWAGVDPATGAPMYYDVDGNITFVYDAGNRTANHGTYDAPRFGGFGTSFNVKGFFAQLDGTYQQGSKLYNNVTFFSENHGFPTTNQSTVMNTIWKNPGDITEVQSALFPREFSSKDIEDGSYLRLRKLTVGYDFGSNILKKNKYIKGLAVYATVDNLYTFTKFTGFDPEVSNNIEQFSYPAARTFTFGVDIGL
jgi:TonB-dependent starch-binding outer membrane protein SusC